MELKDIVAIAGMPGLYHVIGQRKNGLIVEALDGSGKKIPTSPNTKVSMLSDIAMFTIEGEERLGKVLLTIHEMAQGDGLQIPEKKSPDSDFTAFLGKVLPNYDNERIYLSDMKKLAGWYGILKDRLNFDDLRKSLEEQESAEETGTETKSASENRIKAEKPVKTQAPKGDTKSKGKSVNTIRKMA